MGHLVTAEQVVAAKSEDCEWTDDAIRDRFYALPAPTLEEILRCEDVSAVDRAWIVIDLLKPGILDDAMESMVERAIRYVIDMSSSTAWLAWADGWISGEDRSRCHALLIAQNPRPSTERHTAFAVVDALDNKQWAVYCAVVYVEKEAHAAGLTGDTAGHSQIEDLLKALEADNA